MSEGAGVKLVHPVTRLYYKCQVCERRFGRLQMYIDHITRYYGRLGMTCKPRKSR